MLDPSMMIHRLSEIGVALTSIRDVDHLLEHIIEEACQFANCDGGTLYIQEGSSLRLAVWRNETLRRRDGRGGGVVHEGRFIPVSETWMAGYCAATGRAVNIGDVYEMPPGAPYGFNPVFDQENDYRTQSMLCVPMTDNEGNIVGTLQLINALDADAKVATFPAEIEPLVRSLASQAAVAIRNAQLHKQLRDAHIDTIFRLSVASEYRDQETSRHIQRISAYSHVIALQRGLGAAEAEMIRVSSPMHDIGKLGVPDAVLRKPGKLTDEEFEVMKQHTLFGERILQGSNADILQQSAVVAVTHHERWDGRGYPRHLAGESIPLSGRIVGLVDAFDAISSKRVYKPARGFEESVEILQRDTGTHFDPECVAALTGALDRVFALYSKLSIEEGPEEFQFLAGQPAERGTP